MTAQPLTLVELNCENLFDTRHDSLKQDTEYLPQSTRHWTKKRYWRKLNNIAQEILSTIDDDIPQLVALCEVENDTVMRDLTRRSLLRNAGYEYVMTASPDVRGIDVALLYSPVAFRLLHSHALRVTPLKGMRPTRDILYVKGLLVTGDTLHVVVVHMPSRYGGETHTRPFRQAVAARLCELTDSIRGVNAEALILVAGDFNDPADGHVIKALDGHALHCLTIRAHHADAIGGTYRYQGRWQSIDHVLASPAACRRVDSVYVHAPQFLLEPEKQYGGYRPRRTYNGIRYQPGFSDHLPLVVRLRL